jgi:hypothetical protein
MEAAVSRVTLLPTISRKRARAGWAAGDTPDDSDAGSSHAFAPAPRAAADSASAAVVFDPSDSTATPHASAVDPFLLFTCLVRARVLHPAAARSLGSLCRALRAEEQLWDALAQVHLGRLRRTALHAAAKSGDTARAAWLLARGAAINAADCVRAAAPRSAGRVAATLAHHAHPTLDRTGRRR